MLLFSTLGAPRAIPVVPSPLLVTPVFTVGSLITHVVAVSSMGSVLVCFYCYPRPLVVIVSITITIAIIHSFSSLDNSYVLAVLQISDRLARATAKRDGIVLFFADGHSLYLFDYRISHGELLELLPYNLFPCS
jgi:hypothetical protein